MKNRKKKKTNSTSKKSTELKTISHSDYSGVTEDWKNWENKNPDKI